MSKPLNRRAAANAFARGETGIRTGSALTFVGDIAWSYCEPIAIREGSILHVTTAKFSMTTSHHRGAVVGAWAVTHQIGNVPSAFEIRDVDHGTLRQMARDRGQGGSLGRWGAHFDPPGRVAA